MNRMEMNHGTCSMDSGALFRIALTADFFNECGESKYRDIGLDLLAAETNVVCRTFDEHFPEIAAEQLADTDAVLIMTPRLSVASLEQADDLLVAARFGVGYDGVDVRACTERDVAVTIAVGSVDRPVAEATVAWMLALAYHVSMKDRLVREARWDDRSGYMATDLRDCTLGIIGFGGIGKTLVRLLAGFGMQPPLVFDPYVPASVIAEEGAVAVDLERLLREADFVSLHCPLTPQTKGLLSRDELALMKPTAFLINTARGGIVDEGALYEALSSRRIAGAALDCFVDEPLRTPPRFAELDNVLLAPHSIAWSHRLFRDIGQTALRSILDLHHGRRPKGVVNPEVFDRAGFQAKWERRARVVAERA